MSNQAGTSTIDTLAARGFITAARVDNAVFARAMRHSRRVRLLRWLVPASVGAICLVVTLATYLDPLRIIRLPGSASGMVISGTKITMEQPKLSGYTRDARWYELTAQAASQDLTKPDMLELQRIRAKIETQDKSTINLTAMDGTFDRKTGVLTLNRDIVLKSSNGTEVRLNDAVVDTGTGDVVSNKPVEVQMLQGTINSNRLEVTNGGDVIRFEGGVTMYLPANEEQKPVNEPKAVKR